MARLCEVRKEGYQGDGDGVRGDRIMRMMPLMEVCLIFKKAISRLDEAKLNQL